MEITLDKLLASREDRCSKQLELINAFPSYTLVCLTVVIPGAVKRNFHSLIIANAALTAVLECFKTSLRHIEVRDLVTGYEAFLLVEQDTIHVKSLACHIEDTHPLGRLFDLDVISNMGTPISRVQMGLQPRQCLLCEHEARYCMRNHTHSLHDLQEHITQMIDDYVR